MLTEFNQMEVMCVQAREMVVGQQNVILNRAPTSLEESPGKAIRARNLVARGTQHDHFGLLLSEAVIQTIQITSRHGGEFPT